MRKRPLLARERARAALGEWSPRDPRPSPLWGHASRYVFPAPPPSIIADEIPQTRVRSPFRSKNAKRAKITREQMNALVKSFEAEPLPNFEQRQDLAKSLSMTPRSVQIWFQNRRQRLKPTQPKMSTLGQAIGGGHCLTTPPTRSCTGSTLNAANVARPYHPYHQQQQQHNVAVQNLSMSNLAAANAASALPPHPAPAPTSASGAAGFESLVLGHAMSQLAGQVGTSGTNFNSLEPFAATKALLSAGYAPGATPLDLSLSPLGASPHFGAPSSLSASAALAGALPNAIAAGLAACGQKAMPEATAAAAAAAAAAYAAATATAPSAADAPKSDGADGLLMLLACADKPTGQQGVVA